MTWLDFVVILLVVAGAVLEARRGAVCAVIDCLGMGLLVWVAGTQYKSLAAGLAISELTCYLLLFVIGAVLLIVLSTVLDAVLKWDVGGIENVVGGILGVLTGYFFAHGVVSSFVVSHGSDWPPYARSMLASECYNYSTYRAVIGALQGLGGGPRIVDQINEANK